MRTLALVGIAMLMLIAPLAASQTNCNHTFADPATVNQFDDPITGATYYCEERDSFHPNSPPIPSSGYVSGNGTWCYEETNGLRGTMERGHSPIFSDWFPPGCDPNAVARGHVVWEEEGPGLIDDPAGWAARWNIDPAGNVGVLCLWIEEDPINDDACVNGVEFGADTRVVGFDKGWTGPF